MKQQIANSLLLIAIGFLGGFLLFYKADKKVESKPLIEYRDNIVTETVVDTFFLPAKSSGQVTKKPRIYVNDAPKGGVKGDLNVTKDKKNYRDTLEVSTDFKLTYNALVTGTLDSITIGYIDSRPIKVVKETTTNTIVKKTNGFYLGASSDIHVGALYQKDKHIFIAEMNVLNPNYRDLSKYRISYFRKIF